MRDAGGLRSIDKGVVRVNIERLLIIAIRIAIRCARGEGGTERPFIDGAAHIGCSLGKMFDEKGSAGMGDVRRGRELSEIIRERGSAHEAPLCCLGRAALSVPSAKVGATIGFSKD